MRSRDSEQLRGEPSRGTMGAANSSPQAEAAQVRHVVDAQAGMRSTMLPTLMEKPITRLMRGKVNHRLAQFAQFERRHRQPRAT